MAVELDPLILKLTNLSDWDAHEVLKAWTIHVSERARTEKRPSMYKALHELATHLGLASAHCVFLSYGIKYLEENHTNG